MQFDLKSDTAFVSPWIVVVKYIIYFYSLQKDDDASSVATTEDEDSQFEQLFCSIVLAKKEGGREICEMFKLLPSKSVSMGLLKNAQQECYK